jgi:hypothetical protein
MSKTTTLSSDDLKVLNFTLSLRDRCLALAEAEASEINGDIDAVDPEDLEFCLAGLTESNLQETAGKLAQLAAWCN